MFIKLFLARPATGAVSRYRLEGSLRDRLIECLLIANCLTLTHAHAGAHTSPLKHRGLLCSLESCAGEDSPQRSQHKLLILKKGNLHDGTEITVSFLSFSLSSPAYC